MQIGELAHKVSILKNTSSQLVIFNNLYKVFRSTLKAYPKIIDYSNFNYPVFTRLSTKFKSVYADLKMFLANLLRKMRDTDICDSRRVDYSQLVMYLNGECLQIANTDLLLFCTDTSLEKQFKPMPAKKYDYTRLFENLVKCHLKKESIHLEREHSDLVNQKILHFFDH